MNGTQRDDRGDRSAEDYVAGRERRLWHVILGVALILGGVALLASRAEWLDLGSIWHWWPLILIGLGVSKLLFDRAEERGGAIWLLAAGVYCGIGVWEPYGLSWATGWPVMIVAAGVSFLLGGAGWAACVVIDGPRRSSNSATGDSSVAGRALHGPADGKEVRHGN
ncbi:MAG: LiaF transmembrane domain-containing protein [Thermoanaerobaculia bacterium]